jgi:3-oxoadipate enol-lactonase
MSTQTVPDRTLALDGATLHWRLEGTGTAVVLLHGWALDLQYWDPVSALLASGHTILRFDRRGFGLSHGWPDIHRNVDDLRALLDAAAIGRAVLIGMSQGARLALHFACRHPARTRALVLDGAPAFEAETELPLESYRRLLERQGLPALHTAIAQHPLMALHTADPAVHRALAGVLARYRGLDLQRAAEHATPPDLKVITAPTLILNGALDSAARLTAGRNLQAAIRGATRLELAGAGHLAALDDPQGYARAVSGFCRDLPP